MKYKLKFSNTDFLHEMDTLVNIPTGWGYVGGGWLSQASFDSANAEAEKYNRPLLVKGESRIVVDCEEREQIVFAPEDMTVEQWKEESLLGVNVVILERKIVELEATEESVEQSYTQYYYIIPKLEHTEWFCEKNYEVIEEDPNSAEYKLEHYRELRQAEYPVIADQMDMMYWDKVNGTNNWELMIEAIKAKYPKS